jgi:hypothetical protein
VLLWFVFARACILTARLKRTECCRKLPFEVFMRQPMRTSRVVEAALRTAQHNSTFSCMTWHLTSIYQVQEITSPEGVAHSANLLQNKRLAVRCCSQQISTLKAISQPLALHVVRPEDGLSLLSYQIQVAACVALAGPTIHGWATGVRRGGGGGLYAS